MTIGFVGLSHLGIVSSAAIASKGFRVVAYDPDAVLCNDLRQYRLPLHEPQLPELLAASATCLDYTSDVSELSNCSVIFFSMDVQTDTDNLSDLSDIRQLIEHVVSYAAPGTTLVVLSQVPPGFTRGLFRQYADCEFHIYYQVETLIFGQAVERALSPERFIIGCSNAWRDLPDAYERLLKAFDCPILPMRYESAELAKISINMFLVSSISTANTLAEICEVIGANWSEIVPALKLDARIGSKAYLNPGLGIAGGNLERDLMTVKMLGEEHGTGCGVVDAWLANNSRRQDWVLKILHGAVLTEQHTPTIGVWGLAYKPETDSTKNSPALALIKVLPHCLLRVYDPAVDFGSITRPSVVQVDSALEACAMTDALVVMTPWSEFAGIDLELVRDNMSGCVIVDPYGLLDSLSCRDLGFKYFCLGLPFPEEDPFDHSS